MSSFRPSAAPATSSTAFLSSLSMREFRLKEAVADHLGRFHLSCAAGLEELGIDKKRSRQGPGHLGFVRDRGSPKEKNGDVAVGIVTQHRLGLELCHRLVVDKEFDR